MKTDRHSPFYEYLKPLHTVFCNLEKNRQRKIKLELIDMLDIIT